MQRNWASFSSSKRSTTHTASRASRNGMTLPECTYSSPRASSSGASIRTTSGHHSGWVRGSLTTSHTSPTGASINAW